MMVEQRIFYGTFKKYYADCETVSGSYDKQTKTIIVIIPEERVYKKPAQEVSREAIDSSVVMPYKQYKERYADCKTIPGSYNKSTGCIRVIVPDGRMKASGVRGEHFRGYELWMMDANGKKFYSCFRAVSEENAKKQRAKWCKQEGYTPCEPPEGKIAHIYR